MNDGVDRTRPPQGWLSGSNRRRANSYPYAKAAR
jgi:hypothetical protein